MLCHKLRRIARQLITNVRPTQLQTSSPRTNAALLFPLSNLSQKTKKAVSRATDKDIRRAPAYATRQRDGVYVPDESTYTDAYKVLALPSLPSKTKEIAFQILNRTLWTQNKAFKSGIADNPDCKFCGAPETMEHLLHQCPHYSELVWATLGQAFTGMLSQHQGVYIPRIEFTPLHIIFNKPHPSILIHVKDANTRNGLLQLIQEVKREIYYRRQSTPHPEPTMVHVIRITAHILTAVRKLQHLKRYQGKSPQCELLCLLRLMENKLKDAIEDPQPQ